MDCFLSGPCASASLGQVEARILADQLLDQVTPLQTRLVEATMGIGSDRPVREHELARAEQMSVDRLKAQLNAGMAKMRQSPWLWPRVIDSLRRSDFEYGRREPPDRPFSS